MPVNIDNHGRFNRLKSKVHDIEKLHIHAIPAKPINVVKACKTAGVVVLVDDKGTIYSSGVDSYTYWTTTKRMASTVDSLVKLKLISAEALRQHNAAAAAEEKARAEKYAATDILAAYETVGLKLPARTLERLRRLSDGMERLRG